MKIRSITLFFSLLCCGLFGWNSAQAQLTDDQIAIQLGAIQLGIADLSTATAQEQVNALAQGRLALKATQTKFDPQAFVAGATTPQPQSAEFRTQLEQATQNALANPLSLLVNGRATLANGRSVKAKGKLDPSATTASAIVNTALRRIPNASPQLVVNGIQAAAADKFGKPGTGLKDAYRLAERAMTVGLRTYAKGTRQWGPISSTAPSLPNFSDATVDGVAPSLNGLMDAASGIAANAINALGTLKTTPDVVAGITASLVKGAARFQKTSQTTIGGQLVRYGGTTSATATGLVGQVAGTAQSDWTNATSGDLLNAIVRGAMRSSRKQVVSIAYGAAVGFAGTYTATGGSAAAFDINTAAADILGSFKATKAVRAKNEFDVNSAILAGLNVGLNSANWSDPVNGVAGLGGIKDFTVVNGGGAPLTDTVGL